KLICTARGPRCDGESVRTRELLMKCEVCLPLLEEYVDGELKESEAAQVNAHLVTCTACASEVDSLSAEQEIYARYDREITVPAAMWNAIAAETVNAEPVVEPEPRS